MAKVLFFRRMRRADPVSLDVLVNNFSRRAWLDRLTAAQFVAVVVAGGLVTASAVYAAADADHLRYFQSLVASTTKSVKTALAPAAKRTEHAHGAPVKWKVETREAARAVSSRCNPNYSGCVPNARDVDCAGGNGNGPAFSGRVMVIGVDVYGLDGDGDGIGCE